MPWTKENLFILQCLLDHSEQGIYPLRRRIPSERTGLSEAARSSFPGGRSNKLRRPHGLIATGASSTPRPRAAPFPSNRRSLRPSAPPGGCLAPIGDFLDATARVLGSWGSTSLFLIGFEWAAPATRDLSWQFRQPLVKSAGRWGSRFRAASFALVR
jgi:hypothetical protein